MGSFGVLLEALVDFFRVLILAQATFDHPRHFEFPPKQRSRKDAKRTSQLFNANACGEYF